jgi:23S rRNA (uracil1939-C5)-methyltransferase
LLEIEITGIAPGGVGFAETDRGRVYVRDTVPGDRVEVGKRRSERGRTWARVTRIISRKPGLREPACRHFGVCGGCDWMDLPYADQVAMKREMVEEAFRQERLRVEVAEPIASPEEMRYRNRVSFCFGNGDQGPAIGLYERSDPLARSRELPPVVEIDECLLVPEVYNRVKQSVRDALGETTLRAYNPETRAGVLRYLEIKSSSDRVVVDLSVANDKHVPVEKLRDKLSEESNGVSGFAISVGRARSRYGPPKRHDVVFGDETHHIDLLGKSFRYSGAVFSQVNAFQIETLYTKAIEMLAAEPGDTVLDLYCGVGTLSVLIGDAVGAVTGVDLDERAVFDAKENAARNGQADRCQFVCGDVGDGQLWKTHLDRYHRVVVNPPRAGIAKRAVEGIAATRATRVIYVSCNPETLARDCRLLSAHRYSITRVIPVDMFPQTTHVECVALLERT